MGHKKQHINPEVYLKHFATKNFVYLINLKDKYRQNIQRKGIGDRVFWGENYYNFPNRKNEPILEKMFGKVESQTYEKIIENIENRTNLGYDTKQLLIEWLFMLKFRSKKFRDNFSELNSWLEKTMHGLKYGKESMQEKEEFFKESGKKVGKGMQLSAFLNKEIHPDLKKSFSLNFLYKHWEILEAEGKYFITSDNPGYSYTCSIDLIRLNISPISSMYNMNNSVNSFHVFPLTNDKCLLLSPIMKGDLPEINEKELEKLVDSEIKFRKCTESHLNQLNEGTATTAYNLIIGKKESDLKKYS